MNDDTLLEELQIVNTHISYCHVVHLREDRDANQWVTRSATRN